MFNINDPGNSDRQPMTNKGRKDSPYAQTILDLEIKTYDIDVAGHVNNAVYIQWFEDLRTKLFNDHFNLPKLLAKNLYPVVISTEIHYKKSLKLFDKPVGKIYVESLNHGIFTLRAEIKLDGKLSASGLQKCVLLDLKNSTIIKSRELQEIIGDLSI
jgi:acyl-CoA thioester hydrolase